MGMGLNHTVYPLGYISLSYKVVFSIEKKQKTTFPPFGNAFLPQSKNILKGHPIIYLLKQRDICDCKHIFLMSSGLMFDDIIMNMIRNKAL